MKIKVLSPLIVLLFFIVSTGFAEDRVVRFTLDGTIHGVTAEHVKKAFEFAEEKKAELVIFELSTPGGIMDPMRNIISTMINSKIPAVVYVAPSGSRATSAGFYITVAADIAAMAPGTHLGSAHPVFGGQESGSQDTENSKTMMKKATEDSVAYVKTLAEHRGRNVEQAVKAVRESVSFTEQEALDQHLIDIIAKDQKDLLGQLKGRTIKRFDGSTVKLHLSKPTVLAFEMTKREKFLSFLADPNIAFLLMSLGMLGLMVELWNPGLILPGVVGVLCLSLFFVSAQLLPINYMGLILIAFALILFLLELKVHSYGALTVSGTVSLVLGATMFIDSPIPEMHIAYSVIGMVAGLILLTMVFLVTLVVSLHRKKPVTGMQGLLQEVGTAQTDLDPEGQIYVHGEIWKAVAPHRINKGEKVRIVSIDGLTLRVDDWQQTTTKEQTKQTEG